MRVAILGAGTSGLFGALVLARDGHDVTLIEKDARPASVDATDVTPWNRPGTPQAHLPHAVVTRGHQLLAARAPDVLERLLAVGAVEFAVSPPPPADPADGALRLLFCRRPLLESVLWGAVEREPRVALRTGTAITSRAELDADLIVDAAGRRSPVARWLETGDPTVEDCGVIYYSQYYRLRRGAELPRAQGLWGPRAELPYALAIVHLADRDVYSITFAIPTFDAELKALRDPRAFAAVAALLPAFAPWADASRAEPIGGVHAMGGLQNALRERAHAAGVVAIGDALCHTNAAYGWGISLGFAHAHALAESLRDHASVDDATRAYHDRVAVEARDRFALSAQLDRARSCAWRGERPPAGDTLAAAQRALAPGMADPIVFRAVIRVMLALAPVETLLDPALHARARAMPPPPAAPAPPTRDAILAAARAAT